MTYSDNAEYTRARLDKADRIVNGKLLWCDFKTNYDRKRNCEFIVHLFLVAVLCAAFWYVILEHF